jgi:hypothetical protein
MDLLKSRREPNPAAFISETGGGAILHGLFPCRHYRRTRCYFLELQPRGILFGGTVIAVTAVSLDLKLVTGRRGDQAMKTIFAAFVLAFAFVGSAATLTTILTLSA